MRVRRILALALCVCVLAGIVCLSMASAAGDVCFIAVNENLLELSYQPYFSGGVTYVPYSVFTNYGIKMYFSYFSDTSVAMLYNSSRQLYFDMKNDTVTDGGDKSYSAKAVLRGGTVYLPAAFVCDYFGGMACTYISGGDYGDIVRIKDENYSLDDSFFLAAASLLMQQRYEAYKAVQAPATPEATPSSTPTPTPTPGPTSTVVTLGFLGLPDEALLTLLERGGLDACFFVTAEDAAASPALLRRLDGEGYALGVLCGEDVQADYAAVSALLYEAARVKTLLATAPEAAQESAKTMGLVVWSPDAETLAGLPDDTEALGLLLDLTAGCDAARDLLSRMDAARFSFRAPRETD